MIINLSKVHLSWSVVKTDSSFDYYWIVSSKRQNYRSIIGPYNKLFKQRAVLSKEVTPMTDVPCTYQEGQPDTSPGQRTSRSTLSASNNEQIYSYYEHKLFDSSLFILSVFKFLYKYLKNNNAILRANGDSRGKIVLAVLLTFQWLLNSEKTRFVSKAVPEI